MSSWDVRKRRFKAAIAEKRTRPAAIDVGVGGRHPNAIEKRGTRVMIEKRDHHADSAFHDLLHAIHHRQIGKEHAHRLAIHHAHQFHHDAYRTDGRGKPMSPESQAEHFFQRHPAGMALRHAIEQMPAETDAEKFRTMEKAFADPLLHAGAPLPNARGEEDEQDDDREPDPGDPGEAAEGDDRVGLEMRDVAKRQAAQRRAGDWAHKQLQDTARLVRKKLPAKFGGMSDAQVYAALGEHGPPIARALFALAVESQHG